jgi:L-cysteine/cystine lyase
MLAHWHHFNCGGMAPMPTSVGAELLRVPTSVVNEGPLKLLAHDEAFLGIETARKTVARFLGADPEEIAFTTQFSTAINIVVEGIEWHEGDEFIVTDQEHPAMLIPLMNMARRRGLVVKRIPIAERAEEMLTSFRDLLSDRTRLVAVSHVTTDSGTILPAEEMTRLAHEQGSLVLFDGAHSAGDLPLDVKALDCDFYALVGYKWLLGPYPSAVLYIKGSLLEEIDMSWTGSRATKGGSVTMGVDDLHWIDGARRFEYGGRTFSYDTAMATGVNYVDQLGIDQIRAHQQRLSTHFHRGLTKIPDAKIHSPCNPADGTGINTVSIASMNGVAFSAALRDRFKIITRPALRGTTVRISLAVYHEASDIDYLLQSIATLANE